MSSAKTNRKNQNCAGLPSDSSHELSLWECPGGRTAVGTWVPKEAWSSMGKQRLSSAKYNTLKVRTMSFSGKKKKRKKVRTIVN